MPLTQAQRSQRARDKRARAKLKELRMNVPLKHHDAMKERLRAMVEELGNDK